MVSNVFKQTIKNGAYPVRRLLSLFALALMALPVAAAQVGTPSTRDIGDIMFSEIERHVIHNYYGVKPGVGDDDGNERYAKGKKDKGLPPGLAKKEELPPGLAKQLERNGTLPPGLAKRDLPYDLESRLPLLPKTHKRVIVDEDIVLIEKATGRILDILFGAVKQ
jgi:hypothetical protein